MSRRLIWQLFPAFLAVAFGSLLVVGVFAMHSLGRMQQDRLRADLDARARMLARLVAARDPVAEADTLDRWCKELGRQTGARLTVVAADGRVLGDSGQDPLRMDPHDARPEIAAALAGGVGESLRYSATVGEQMLYVAVPVYRNGDVVGAARVALPQTAVREQRAALRRRMLAGGAAAAALAALLSLGISRRLSRPITDMMRLGERYASGELEARVSIAMPEEAARLADVLHRMADELKRRMELVVQQRNEREAVLSAMSEGVFTVDGEERVRTCNAAAARLLNATPEGARGRPVCEVARSTTLQAMISRILRDGRPGECDLVFRIPQERFVQARGGALPPREDSAGSAAGVLVVMTDVTRLKRLESVRRDFVANVSHELKTPITSIRAACETLLDGGADADGDAQRFLAIIHRQAARLESIVEDLLSLSRLEYDTERDRIRREHGSIQAPLEAAVSACQSRAERRGVRLTLACGDAVSGPVNAALIEQAVINLMDNAVKFSAEGGEVRVCCEKVGDWVRIRVSDDGPGIPPGHQDRIFERFYCVDPGRSRKLGGTGLGLAIVKHIALAHGGVVRVESEPGRGSTFILDLPVGAA